MVVLSLFDGMSCGQIALKKLSVSVDKYYACEVDKYAIQQTLHNFPNTIQLGDVCNVDVSKLDHIDILIGGSPCQSFSFAGKRNGMSTTSNEEIYTLDRYMELKNNGFEFEGESYLFWEYMRILTDIRKYNPNVLFLLENVEMGKKWEYVLSEAVGLFGVHINSALVSAQNRKRIYWTNIRTRQEGLFGELHSDIPQPKDRKILLKDILQPESEIDEKYYLSKKMIEHLICDKDLGNGVWKGVKSQNGKKKSRCLNARMHKMGKSDNYIKCDKKLNIKPNQQKSSCFTASGNSGGNHSDMDILVVPMSVSCLTSKRTEYGKRICKEYESGLINEKRKNISQLEPRNDNKTNTLTTVQKDNLIIQLNLSRESDGNQPYQQNRAYDTNGKQPVLNAQSVGWNNIRIPEATKNGYIDILPGECVDLENINSKTRRGRKMNNKSNCLMSAQNAFHKYTEDFRLRRLTPIECARLQTIPSWYEWVVSDTQTYRMLGNGWTVEVIKYILSFLTIQL
jgi:DNA (cytosine-5)-methyltransferase 3A